MIDSKRLAVLKALTDYLAGEIRESNGYQHDMDEERVRRGILVWDNSDPVPAVSILENIDPDRFPRLATNDYDAGMAKSQWILLIQGWAKDNKLNPTDNAYYLMADVEKALAKLVKRANPMTAEVTSENYLLGGLIAGMTMEPGIARPPMEELSSRAFFWKRIVITLVEDANDPYLLN